MSFLRSLATRAVGMARWCDVAVDGDGGMVMRDLVPPIEGVNLDDTVFNTNDLSTIRGSSPVLEPFG